MGRLIVLIVAMLSAGHAFAEISGKGPRSFSLICNKVIVMGYSLGNDRIPASYITWDQSKKSLTIKSEELNEFHGELNPSYYEIYARHRKSNGSEKILITFKNRSFADKWEQEEAAHFVSAEFDFSSTSKGALLKLTDFWQTYGAISRVQTKHAFCEER